MKKCLLALAIAALAATGAMAQDNDTIAKIKANGGKVVMGVRDSSGLLSYTLGNGVYAGLHPDVCRAVLQNIAKKEGINNLTIEYMSVTSQNRIPLVQNGTVDIECGSTTNNKARQQQVSFALTTFVSEVRTAVKSDSGIASITQLGGKTIATTTGTTSVQLLRKHEKATGVDFKEIFGKDHADSFLLLESGRADAFIMDDYILAGNIAMSKSPKDFRVVGEALAVEPIAIMLRKDDAKFKKAVDDELRAMFKNGEFAKLYNKWFLQPIPPKNTAAGVQMGEALKVVIANPNDAPAEDYVRK